MRGTPTASSQSPRGRRITPAHAGNTRFFLGTRSLDPDHPRTCGEHAGIGVIRHVGGGAPPHMRGTHSLFDLGELVHGITPAHAGNTSVVRSHLNAA